MAIIKRKKPEETEIFLQALDHQILKVRIVGKTPLIVNRMSAKTRNILLLGGSPKTKADKAKIKHHPLSEFVETMYIDQDFHEDTIIKFPAGAFKSAMGTAAKSTEGIFGTDVARLIDIPNEYCPIFGVPKLRMDVVRTAGMNKTPDIRTRACFAEWYTEFTVGYIAPTFGGTSVHQLLSNATIVCGVGENRQEKGKGSFGSFAIAEHIPEDFEI